MIMKIIALLCLLFALYQTVVAIAIQAVKNELPQADPNELSEEEVSCVNELHLDINNIKGITSLDIVPEDNENFNKYLSCYWKKLDLANADGKINLENVQQVLTAAALSEINTDDSQLKLMIQLLFQATILECSKTSNITIAKFQNCITHEMEKLANS